MSESSDAQTKAQQGSDGQRSIGVRLIEAERARQKAVEGWTATHDDEHTAGEMAMAAVCYAAPARVFIKIEHAAGDTYVDPWPWAARWDKRFRCGERRDNPGNVPPRPETYSDEERLDLLVKAGAFLAAEIDRLKRATQQNGGAP